MDIYANLLFIVYELCINEVAWDDLKMNELKELIEFSVK